MINIKQRLRPKVRNNVDLTMHPDVLFLNPWRDPGFRMLLEPEFIWRKIPKGRVSAFAVSSSQSVNDKIERLIRRTENTGMFGAAIEYNTVPVVLDKVSFKKSFVQARDRLILSGAAGTRLINRFRWENSQAEIDADTRLEVYFAKCRAENNGKEIPLYSGMLEPDMAFAIPCRNTFNYFHFVTESLCQLTVLDGLDFQGDIFFHFPNSEESQQPFAKSFVETLFPEYAGRVFFERTPKEYQNVLTAYDMVGGHYQTPEAGVVGIERHIPDSLKQGGGITSTASRVPLSRNTVNASLIALRDRALKAIDGQDFSHLPKRFFVGRDTRKSRERHMEGEDKLFEHLAMFGFEYVVFESLSPLEQIALMAQAEIMVSYHGAGFTNMLFANPKAYVIEIGTLQTARLRWGDFWPLAHASQCNYINFFADFKSEDVEIEPVFETEGLVPASISEEGTGQVMALVVALLGQFPKFQTPKPVVQLTRQLIKVGGAEQAVKLIEQHDELLGRNAILCLLKADCHKALDEPKSELMSLDLAYKANPSRWQTLVRMIWCANRCERPQVIRWALSRLQTDFPQRHDAFVRNHEWVRFVA